MPGGRRERSQGELSPIFCRSPHLLRHTPTSSGWARRVAATDACQIPFLLCRTDHLPAKFPTHTRLCSLLPSAAYLMCVCRRHSRLGDLSVFTVSVRVRCMVRFSDTREHRDGWIDSWVERGSQPAVCHCTGRINGMDQSFASQNGGGTLDSVAHMS